MLSASIAMSSLCLAHIILLQACILAFILCCQLNTAVALWDKNQIPSIFHTECISFESALNTTVSAGKPLTDLLGPLLSHPFSLPSSRLQHGVVYQGDASRMRRIVRDLISGKRAVKIGVIGTSVSFGTGASKRLETGWFALVEQSLKRAFPRAVIQARNGCYPGTGSGFANMCLRKMVDADVDLLLMEFVTNDFSNGNYQNDALMMAYERLVRKALQMKQRPAVVLMQYPTWGQCFAPNMTDPSGHLTKRDFHQSAEDIYGSVAQYYGLPWLSFRSALWHDAQAASPLAPQGWRTFSEDHVHPNDRGHRAFNDLLMWLVLQTAMDLISMPFAKHDVAYIKAPLPPPMYRGNYEEVGELCMLDEDLDTAVDRAASGPAWSLINEGTAEKRKLGYISTTPDTTLVLRLNMSAALGTPRVRSLPKVQRMASVMLSYLKSYTHMGVVEVTCASGCTCAPKKLDAHHTQRTSTTYMAMTPTEAQGPECVVHVRILPETSSGEHKFKVTAVMLNRLNAMGFAWSDTAAAEMKLHEMFSGEISAAQTRR